MIPSPVALHAPHSKAITNLLLVTIYWIAMSTNIYKRSYTVCNFFAWIILFSIIILRFIPVVLCITSSLFLHVTLYCMDII